MPPRERVNNGNNNNNNDGNLVQDFIVALQGFAQGAHHQHANPQNQTSLVVEQFLRYSPSRFDGKSGPLVMEEWIRELERIFEHIECTDAQRISCVLFQLCEDASHWWDSYRRSMTEQERQALTWDGFKRIVTDNYFLRSYRNQKEAEFLDLKQGTQSVMEYERQFNQLSRYATRLIDTNDQKADRFLRGLRPEIRGILAAQGIEDFGVAVRRAHEVEVGLEIDKLPFKNAYRNDKRKRENQNNGEGDSQNKKERNENKQEGGPLRTYPQCSECHKYHLGKCMYRSGVCYYCHEPGHNAIRCPKKEKKEPERKGNARLFYMGQLNDDENTK